MVLPKITVITPTFNTGETIKISLLSVAKQTYKNIEHIIVDGASKDKTLPTIRRYQKLHKNIRLLTEKDSGIYNAMNKGLDLCTGDWIFFLGADDSFYDKQVLEDLYDQGLFQEEQVVYGNVIIKGDAPWAKDGSIYDGPFTLEKLFRWNICHQSIFYPRSVIKQVGYFETKYKVTSDWDYNIRCWAKYKFSYIDKIIAFFMTGGKSSEGGDYALHLDFPDNVIKYFQLDVHDANLYHATSQFYYPMARYRENEYVNNIHELKEETESLKQKIANQKKEHSESVTEIQKQHEISIVSLRSEFEEVFSNFKAEQENFHTNLRAEYSSNIAKLKTESELAISRLKEEHALIIAKLTEEHAQVLINLNEEHAQILTNLRTEHLETIRNLTHEHDLFVNTLKAENADTINKLKGGYEDTILSMQEEKRAFWELFRQKETEFMQVIDLKNNLIENLSNTITDKDLYLRDTVTRYDNSMAILNGEINLKNQQIATIYNSYTWKTGKFLLAPIFFIMKKIIGRK